MYITYLLRTADLLPIASEGLTNYYNANLLKMYGQDNKLFIFISQLKAINHAEAMRRLRRAKTLGG
jgi:hypothetical protein